MLSGFKNFYSKSVDLIKQVQDQVAVKGQASTPVPTVAPEDTHPGFHLVDRWSPAPPHACVQFVLRTRAYRRIVRHAARRHPGRLQRCDLFRAVVYA